MTVEESHRPPSDGSICRPHCHHVHIHAERAGARGRAIEPQDITEPAFPD